MYQVYPYPSPPLLYIARMGIFNKLLQREQCDLQSPSDHMVHAWSVHSRIRRTSENLRIPIPFFLLTNSRSWVTLIITSLSPSTFPVSAMSTWQERAAEKKRRQTASIPSEWLITPPADDVLDVTDVPAGCGLLSARELEITAVNEVAVLLNKLATGEWSSVEVTTAFCKRAIIAHQLVCPFSLLPVRW